MGPLILGEVNAGERLDLRMPPPVESHEPVKALDWSAGQDWTVPDLAGPLSAKHPLDAILIQRLAIQERKRDARPGG